MAGIDTFEKSWLYAAPDVEKMGEGCSDEGVPISTVLKAIEIETNKTQDTDKDLEDFGIEKNCLTYVWWRGCFRGSELELREPNAVFELLTSGEAGNIYRNTK